MGSLGAAEDLTETGSELVVEPDEEERADGAVQVAEPEREERHEPRHSLETSPVKVHHEVHHVGGDPGQRERGDHDDEHADHLALGALQRAGTGTGLLAGNATQPQLATNQEEGDCDDQEGQGIEENEDENEVILRGLYGVNAVWLQVPSAPPHTLQVDDPHEDQIRRHDDGGRHPDQRRRARDVAEEERCSFQRTHHGVITVERAQQESEDRGGDWEYVRVMHRLAQHHTEDAREPPSHVQKRYRVGHDDERHQQVRHRHVQDQVVGHSAHARVAEDHVDHHNVA